MTDYLISMAILYMKMTDRDLDKLSKAWKGEKWY